MDDLLSRHRKEKRDLQARITQKKKSASKKTRKGVNDECDRLEAEMKERHAQELAVLDGTTPSAEDNDLENDAATAVKSEPLPNGDSQEDNLTDVASDLSKLELSEAGASQSSKKPNRQKARLARRAAEQARLAEEAEEEAADMPDFGAREKEIMADTFKKHALHEKEIRPDGHCLYSAVADQLRTKGRDIKVGNVLGDNDDFRIVRHVAANHIEAHQDDFAPFLEEDLSSYVQKIRETGEWGGQIELQALAKAYNLRICVVQGDGKVTEIGDGDDAQRIWLAYYRHGFGLGEHYNSLRQEEKQ
jgi:OTU domain-containing protein 6